MTVLLVFVDGIGLGTPGAHNPFDGGARGVLEPLAGRGAAVVDGWTLVACDPRMGVAGLPQSATGTATILTGMNVPEVVGEHQPAYPSARVETILEEHSILRRVRDAGMRSAYLNAFPPGRADRDADIPRGACTLAAMAGNGPLRTFDDLHAGRAATFDLTHEIARAFGAQIEPRSMDDACAAVARGASEVDLALFEMFFTDTAGHRQNTWFARREILRTEMFLDGVVRFLDPQRDTVIVTSDHGNLEDLSTRGHTANDVPLLGWGRDAATLVGTWPTLHAVGKGVLDCVLARM